MKARRIIHGAGISAMAFLLAPLSSMARPTGIDVSSYQGSPNWSSVAGSGITFAYAKATEGTFDIDSSFSYNESNGKAAGVYMGAYHFAHPASDSPSTEANYFWSTAGGYVKGDGKSLMPMLDFEVFSGVVGASSYSDWANQFCNDIKSKASANGVTVKPVIYTSACTACNFNSSVDQWFAWIANYNGESSQSGTPWSSCGNCDAWGTGVWDIWQYSSSGSVSGISGAVDMDVFNGNSSDLVSSLVIGNQTSPRIDVFGRGLDNALWHKYYDPNLGGWSGWYSLGGTIASDPGSVSRMNNSIDIFARVANNSIWHISWNGNAWSSWSSLGGSLVGSPDACSQNQNNVDVFARGPDNAMWHNWWNGSAWSGWYSMGGSFNSDPGSVSRGHGLENVFAKVGDNSLWTDTFNGAWSGWSGFGGNCIGGPDALSQNINQVEVFVRGSDSSLYHKWWNGSSWSGWAGMGGSMASDPGAVSRGNGIMDVFFQVGDGSCWHTYYVNGGWQGFYPFGGLFNGGMDAASWSNVHP